MKDFRWFEKKWFVNLKIKTRMTICFLVLAAITTIAGIGGALYIVLSETPNWLAFIIGFGALCVIEIVVALILADMNAFLVIDPVQKNEKIITNYSGGNLDTSKILRPRDRVTMDYQDEIGSFTRVMGDLMVYMRNLEKCIRKVAEGDLTAEVPVCSSDDQIGTALKKLVDNFHNLVSSMVGVIEKVSSGSELVSGSSQALSQGTTEQASVIEELNAALEQIASQTRLNAENAQKANELTKDAKEYAAEGNVHMGEMLQAMEEISVSSKNINNIIKVIQDIAFQTNILALNAAVEAARAGQHGKGFAVVADEVKNLAGKSANAAKETTELIENSIRKVEVGYKIANQTAEALHKIVEQIDSAAGLIQSITQASQEQANGIEQVNLGIIQVSQVVQNNAAVAEESAATSQELSAHASNLMSQSAIFKL